jgi:maltose/moltooligosaccharide transporter
MLGMPRIMKQLALVQFFSWFALFIMWTYFPAAIAQNTWGVGTEWYDAAYIAQAGGVPAHIAAAKGAAGDWVGILYAGYSLFAVLFSLVMAKLANVFGRKFVYSMALLAGGAGYLSFALFTDPTMTHVDLFITQVDIPQGALGLMFPMVGVGIAWAAILAMPYAILAGALPANKTGVYMGIFNFTIAAPQIVSGLIAGWILGSVFENQAVYIVMLAGAAMVLGALSVWLVKEQDTQAQV